MMIPNSFIFGIGLTIVSGSVFILLVKGFFTSTESDPQLRILLRESDHPRLFEFIRQVCEEVGVEEPDRVFALPEVNAAVHTRTSLVNLFVPPKRDLLIGLGLVNALNLSEFKAVLAHEFGHFAQGGWLASYYTVVYRLSYDIVRGRDWFDEALEKACNSFVPLNVIAMASMHVMGAFRWLLERIFVAIAFRQFTVIRENEFHADRVAACVAGSNAITHGLLRTDFAATTYDQTLSDLSKAADHKLYTSDLYYHQHAVANIVRRQKRNMFLGIPPKLKKPEDGEFVQVFDPEKEVDPSEFGDYHPANHDREENVKKHFVVAEEDTRSSWILFNDPIELRGSITAKVYRRALKLRKGTELSEPEKVQKFIDDEHAETTYDPRYEGVYDDRLISPGDLDELNASIASEPWDDERLRNVYGKLYNNLKGKSEERKELVDELDKVLNESNNAKSRRIKRIVAELEEKIEEIDQSLESFDRRVYMVHIQMAFKVGDDEFNELLSCYRFHMALQKIYKQIRDNHRDAMISAMILFNSANELQPEDFAEIMHGLRKARRTLKESLRQADEMDMPAMANFVEGQKLGDFLLDQTLVREFPENFVKGQQIGKLMEQMELVLSRSSRLHFKSLGGILALQERAAAGYLSLPQPA